VTLSVSLPTAHQGRCNRPHLTCWKSLMGKTTWVDEHYETHYILVRYRSGVTGIFCRHCGHFSTEPQHITARYCPRCQRYHTHRHGGVPGALRP
jgi:hypothetical protein